MSGFSSSSTGDFDKAFMTTTELLDKYVAGNLWVCGYNAYGQLGDNSTSNKSSPVQTVAKGSNWRDLSGSAFGSYAIKTDGTLWGWGANVVGELGDNTIINKSSPVQTICGGSNWKEVSSTYLRFTAIKTDGTLWTCGYNTHGELGDNSVINKSSPIQTIAGGTNWKTSHSYRNGVSAIKNDGTLWVYGWNSNGQLGDNTIIDRSSPVQTICGGNNWKSLAVGTGNYSYYAIKTDGTLWCWGANGNGQLGDNTIINRSSPVQTICGGTNWKMVSAGSGRFFAAIKTDGTLWTCGYNNIYGSLGDGSIIDKSSPTQTLCGGNNWKTISSGSYHNAAIKTDGTLWTWGYNGGGQLGDNTSINRSSPVQTIVGGNKWKSVSATNSAIYAVQFSNSIGVE